MKNLIVLFIIFPIAETCYSQLKQNTINKATHISYSVITPKKYPNIIHVYNNENMYGDRNSNQPSQLRIEKPDKHSVLNTFKQVFSTERLQQLAADPSAIFIDYKISPTTGKILEVSFILTKNTLLKATEIESLENALKTNVMFKFKNEEVKNSEFISIDESVHFRKILDGTLIENW